MIRLHRTRTANALGGFTGSDLEVKLGDLLGYYYSDGGKVDFKPKKRQVWGKAKTQLKAESFGKCAYCEADTAVVAHGDVEHFRPKSRYWWLAYCYDNYTFSCQICNQKYKGDDFPITGKPLSTARLPKTMPAKGAALTTLIRSLCPDPGHTSEAKLRKLFSAEDAHLPDPYLVDPETLFVWKELPDAKEVWIAAKGSSNRAKRAAEAVEKVLGLNRTELLRLRWLHYEDMETLALILQEGQFTDTKKRRIMDRLKSFASAERPFAAMKRQYLRSWGLLVE